MKTVDVAIVGAGPSGLSAALCAEQLGLAPILIEEQARIGGQFLRSAKSQQPSLGGWKADWLRSRAEKLRESVEQKRIEVIGEAIVWSIFDHTRVMVSHRRGAEEIGSGQLILAPGAYERVVPFVGWTLPGVYTAGALQILAKEEALPRGNRIILAGSGPFLFGVARSLIERGDDVVAVLEAASLGLCLRNLTRLAGGYRILTQGLRDLAYLVRAGVRIHRQHEVVKAEGDGHLERVVFRKSTAANTVGGSRNITERVDALGVGFGFIPSTELCALAGCNLEYDRSLGGWVPMRSARLESNIPGVFVIGDGAGVRGAAVAMEEGRIAATWAAANAGRITEEEARKRISPAMRRLKSLQKFAQAISEIYSPPEGLYSRISDEVIVCRCEDVRAGEIRSAMSKGFLTMDSIKGRTRAGMGNCQGRICGPTITELISLEAGLRPIEITPSRCRPPIKPVPIGDIAGLRG